MAPILVSLFSAYVPQIWKETRHPSYLKYLTRMFSLFYCFYKCSQFSSPVLNCHQCISVICRLRQNDLVSDTCDISGHTLGSPQSFYVSCHFRSICTPWPHLHRRFYLVSYKLPAFLGIRTLAIRLSSNVSFIPCICRDISSVCNASNRNCDKSHPRRQ